MSELFKGMCMIKAGTRGKCRLKLLEPIDNESLDVLWCVCSSCVLRTAGHNPVLEELESLDS